MIFIIVDAVDECPNSEWTGFPNTPRGRVLDLLQELLELKLANLRICVTSRPEVDIRDILGRLASHRICLHDEPGQKNDTIGSIVLSEEKMRRWRSEYKQLVYLFIFIIFINPLFFFEMLGKDISNRGLVQQRTGASGLIGDR
jgi:hypothetical protein